jgi:hypothetical protein
MSGIDKVIIAYAMKKFLKVTYGVWIKMGKRIFSAIKQHIVT